MPKILHRPKTISPTPLFPIEECPDLMTDGCLCDDSRNLIFASVWGRDTAVQELLARLTLGPSENGLIDFHILCGESRHTVFINNIDLLEKRTTRAYQQTLFGSMIHLWLFDKRCIKPDKANSSALSILPKDARDRTQRLWQLTRDTCPLPLLDHWRDTVLEILNSNGMLSSFPFAIGELEGYRLALDVPALTASLSELIQSGTLGTDPLVADTDTTLRLVA